VIKKFKLSIKVETPERGVAVTLALGKGKLAGGGNGGEEDLRGRKPSRIEAITVFRSPTKNYQNE